MTPYQHIIAASKRGTGVLLSSGAVEELAAVGIIKRRAAEDDERDKATTAEMENAASDDGVGT